MSKRWRKVNEDTENQQSQAEQQRILVEGGMIQWDGSIPREAIRAFMNTEDKWDFQIHRTIDDPDDPKAKQTFSMGSIIETGRLITAFIVSRVIAAWRNTDFSPDTAPQVCVIEVAIKWSELGDD
jgi:hypothetical protein